MADAKVTRGDEQVVVRSFRFPDGSGLLLSAGRSLDVVVIAMSPPEHYDDEPGVAVELTRADVDALIEALIDAQCVMSDPVEEDE